MIQGRHWRSRGLVGRRAVSPRWPGEAVVVRVGVTPAALPGRRARVEFLVYLPEWETLLYAGDDCTLLEEGPR